jgi:8-oxo-dGTP diphosphatase
MSDLVLRVAAKGVVVNDKGQVLIVREAATYQDGTNIGRYHLPGGRIEAGESYVDGLRREIKEETGLDIEPGRPVYVGEWRPVIKGVPHHIIAIFSVCQARATATTLSDEHDEALWINPQDRVHYDLMDPDDKVIDAYMALLSKE